MLTFTERLDRALDSLITEGITRQEFFDLYALIAGYQITKSKAIGKELARVGNRVLKDQVDQLGAMAIIRCMSDDMGDGLGDMDDSLDDFDDDMGDIPSSDESNIHIFQRYGFNTKMNIDDGGYAWNDETARKFKSLPDDKKIAMAKEIIGYTDTQVELATQRGVDIPGFNTVTSIGGVWQAILETFIEYASNPPSTLEELIRRIDQVYGMLHHGGMLTDYMDETEWLEDALHTRDNMTFGQMLDAASDRVRQLVLYPDTSAAQRWLARFMEKRVGPLLSNIPTFDGSVPSKGVTTTQKFLTALSRKRSMDDDNNEYGSLFNAERLSDNHIRLHRDISVDMIDDGHTTTFRYSTGHVDRVRNSDLISMSVLMSKLAVNLRKPPQKKGVPEKPIVPNKINDVMSQLARARKMHRETGRYSHPMRKPEPADLED